MRNFILVAGFTLALLGSMGCSSRMGYPARDVGVPSDAGVDTNFADLGLPDATSDDAATSDAGRDAAAMDAGTDGGHDAGTDAGHDAGADTSARPDAGRCRTGARIGLYAADDLAAHMTVRDFLVPTGVLGGVAIGGPVVDSAAATTAGTHDGRIPTLAELMGYDAVFVWGSGAWDGAAFGNVLADYVDAGGGVVIAVFAQRPGPQTGIDGRMLSAGYLPYVPSGYNFAPLTMGTVAVPGDPIMQGVSSFSGSNIAYHDGPIASGARLIASWGPTATVPIARPIVATLQPGAGRSALLGLYPVRFWDTTTDGARLMANTLLWAAKCQ